MGRGMSSSNVIIILDAVDRLGGGGGLSDMNNEDPIRRKMFLMGLIVTQSTRGIKNFNFLRSEVEKDGQNWFVSFFLSLHHQNNRSENITTFSFAPPQLSSQKEEFSEKNIGWVYLLPSKPLPPQVTPMLIATGDCHKYAEVTYSAAWHACFYSTQS